MTSGPPDPTERYSKGYLRYALGLLMVVYTFNFLDRQIVVILQESIKKEMGLSDKQLGLLSGFTFAIFYATLGIPLARYADRGVRRNVIAWSIGLWSLMTAVAGWARSFPQLLLARIGVGVGEAGGSPPAHAIISDYFVPHERGKALSIYSMGVYLGVLLGFVAGGWLNQFFGWRTALMVVGMPGLIVALLVRFTIKEPRRGESEAGDHSDTPPPFGESVRMLLSLPSFRWLAVAAGFNAFVTYGTGNFAPSFLARIYHLTPGQIGTALGLVAGIGGMVGAFFGGYLGDRLGGNDKRWYLWVPAIAMAIGAPLRVIAYTVSDVRIMLVLSGITEMLALTFIAPSVAMAHALVVPRLRSFVSSILFFILSTIGLGLGPVFTGFMSDFWATRFGPDALRWAMVTTSLAFIPGAWCFHRATRTLRQDIARKEPA